MDVARSRGLRERFPALLVLAAANAASFFFEKKEKEKEGPPKATSVAVHLQATARFRPNFQLNQSK